MSELERRIEAETGAPLATPGGRAEQRGRGGFKEIWRPPYLQAHHHDGRLQFVPDGGILRILQLGADAAHQPRNRRHQQLAIYVHHRDRIAVRALLAAALADKFERKWQIVFGAAGIAVSGLLFGQMSAVPLLIVFGVLLTLSANILSFSSHAYQAELYPTRIRALAVGFTYSWSRLSVVFSSFAIAFFLDRFGVPECSPSSQAAW